MRGASGAAEMQGTPETPYTAPQQLLSRQQRACCDQRELGHCTLAVAGADRAADGAAVSAEPAGGGSGSSPRSVVVFRCCSTIFNGGGQLPPGAGAASPPQGRIRTPTRTTPTRLCSTIFNGNGKLPKELELAVANGVLVNCDSEFDLANIQVRPGFRRFLSLGAVARNWCSVRVRPRQHPGGLGLGAVRMGSVGCIHCRTLWPMLARRDGG